MECMAGARRTSDRMETIGEARGRCVLGQLCSEEEKVSASHEDIQGVLQMVASKTGVAGPGQSEAETRGTLLLLLLFHHVFMFFSSLSFFPFNV